MLTKLSIGLRPLLLLLLLFFIVGCQSAFNDDVPNYVIDGDPGRGRQTIGEYGCGACHKIPGVPRANSTVGPPLDDWIDRYYIAGAVPNQPENLVRWIMNPQEIEPGTAMPDLMVTEQDARDISAYLFSLR